MDLGTCMDTSDTALNYLEATRVRKTNSSNHLNIQNVLSISLIVIFYFLGLQTTCFFSEFQAHEISHNSVR